MEKYADSLAMRRSLPVFALFLMLGAGGSAPNEEALWQHRNLGKAYYEDPVGADKSVDEFAKALALAPNSFREHLNYGLALMKMARMKEAIAQFEIGQKMEPKLPHTWFNLGIAYKRLGRVNEGVAQFETMVKLVPDEAISHYNLGLLYTRAGNEEAAMREFATSAKLNPRLVAPRFQIYNVHRLAEREQQATKALVEFQKVRAELKDADEEEDLEWSWYSEIYDVIEPGDRPGGDIPALRFEDRRLEGHADAATAGISVLDVAGDPKPGLLVWSREGIALYRQGAMRAADSGLESLKDVIHVAAGDWNNDGIPDLCVITTSGVQLFRGERGRFVPEKLTAPTGPYTRAVWLDFDHDYDLDLFLLGPHSVLLRNQGEAGFQPHPFPFIAGDVIDALPSRFTPDTKDADLLVTFRDHEGVVYRDLLRGQYEAKRLSGLPAGSRFLQSADIDQDGWLDIISSAGVLFNRKTSFEAASVPAGYAADPGNRGTTDLITAVGALALNEGKGKFSAPHAVSGLGAAQQLAAADFNGDGWIDFAGVAADGSIHLWTNRTNSTNHWLSVSLAGVKNLKAANGTELEVKAGPAYQKKLYDGVPLVFGLGSRAAVDTLRITWPNGNIQNQVRPELARLLAVKEAPRLSGSCPMIFTWDGREFQFITDVLGVAPLGAGSGDGEVFTVDHDEYVSIPGEALAEKDGRFDLRITEELREVSYVDKVQLLALDHPADVEVLTNEKFKSPPFPEFRLFGVRRHVDPVSARDDKGRDVLDRVLRRDQRYPDAFRRDFGGTAEMHSLDLDFGPRAAKDNRALLVLNGWVDWADGSTFVGASQSGGLQFPSLQMRDRSGRWHTVVTDLGIPAGKPKTIVVDLSGKFLSASREVRLVTNLCVYWDQIYLSEDTATPPTRLTAVQPESAELHFRGFSKALIHPQRTQPEEFIYGTLVSAPWDPVPGRYTRYGDVRAMLAEADDRPVIFGSGDEIAFRFLARKLPPLPAGWRRDYLLLVDGWAKDSDANTAYSQSVEPLPFHRMSGYPYRFDERFPHELDYNTRPAGRLLERLMP